MAESYLSTQVDTRTFGTQIARLVDDLNRPDLQNLAQQYLQDAMRWAQRKAFFFNNTDNTAVPSWVASTNYPQGSTIQVTVSGTSYVIVATNAGVSGTVAPAWSTTIFTPPSGGTSFPPPTVGTAGTTQDNTIIWATVATPYQQNLYTQLSTVYNINQYKPPIDYVAPRLVEVTAANLRIPLTKISYNQLRSYDVIRPAPITVYPTYWAWYQEQIYLWPYANGFYPLTLSYRAAPQIAVNLTDTNMWTTKAERYIRKLAQASIEAEILKDDAAAALSLKAANMELVALTSQMIEQDSGGIPASEW